MEASANRQVARALIVDDEHLLRQIHEAMLNKFHLETDVAKNGKEAVELFASGKSYDLVFMDLEMPVMNGTKVNL